MSLTEDDHLKKERASSWQVTGIQICSDDLQQVQSKRIEEALARHERVLRRQDVKPDRRDRDQTVMGEEVAVPSDSGSSHVHHRDSENAVPSPDFLGLRENKIKKDLEV
jgi:hypothetical protein